MHVGFPDPATATGTEEEILAMFRQVRDGLAERLDPACCGRSAGSAGIRSNAPGVAVTFILAPAPMTTI